MRAPFLLVGISSLAGCGLFFGDATGSGGADATSSTTSGVGGATSSTTGTGGAGGSADCSHRIGTDADWMLGFDGATVHEMTKADGRIYVVGAATGGVANGLPGLAGGKRIFLASIDEQGCDLRVRDLLDVTSGAFTVGISKGGAGVPLVVWSASRTVCAFPADITTLPGAHCDVSLPVTFSCGGANMASQIGDGIVVKTSPATLALRVGAQSGVLTCLRPVVDVVGLQGMYALTEVDDEPRLLGTAFTNVRGAAGAEHARFTGTCEPGSDLGESQVCPGNLNRRSMLLQVPPLDVTTATNLMELGTPNLSYLGSGTVPTPTLSGYVLVAASGTSRHLAWGVVGTPTPSFIEPPPADFQVKSAVDTPLGILVAGQSSRPFGVRGQVGTPAISCPDGDPSCDPFGFFAFLPETTSLPEGRSIPIEEVPGCIGHVAEGAGAELNDAGQVVLALNATCAKLTRYQGSVSMSLGGGFALITETP